MEERILSNDSEEFSIDVWTFIGSGLCAFSCAQSQLANVMLKYEDNINVALEKEGEERMPFCNTYRIFYFFTEIVGALADLLSMGMIPASLWAAISTLNLACYAIISWILISNVTPYDEIAVLSLTTGGALVCVFYGPHVENRDISGVEHFWSNLLEFWPWLIVLIPLTIIVYILCFRYTRKVLEEIQNGTSTIRLKNGQPPPGSVYNLSGIVLASLSTSFFQMSTSVTTKSIASYHWGLFLAIATTLSFSFLHFVSLWFMMENLHATAATPAYTILTFLNNSYFSYMFYNPMYTNKTYYGLGLFIAFIGMQGYLYLRSYTYQEETIEELEMITLNSEVSEDVMDEVLDDIQSEDSAEKVKFDILGFPPDNIDTIEINHAIDSVLNEVVTEGDSGDFEAENSKETLEQLDMIPLRTLDTVIQRVDNDALNPAKNSNARSLDCLTEERVLALVEDMLHDVDSFLASVEEITNNVDTNQDSKERSST